MKSKTTNADINEYFSRIGTSFKSFKEKIMKLSQKNNIDFNEDVFMDTIIRCYSTFPTANATNIDIENYFWKAFKQNSFSNFSRNKFRDTVNFNVFGDGITNEEYNADIDEIVNLIKTEVEREFGSTICDAWILHVCYNQTYEDLEKRGYEGLNLHNEFRQIKRYICNNLIRKNTKLKTLLIDNNFIKG